MLDPRIKPTTPFTEADLAGIEQVVRRVLPEDYRKFVREYGGAFVGGLVDGDAALPILTFFGADAVLAALDTNTDLKSNGMLPVADCELGNLYVIDHGNTVHYINYYGGQTTSRRVADAFSDFLSRIVVSDQ